MNRFLHWCRRFYILIILAIIYIPLVLIVILSFCGQTLRGNIDISFDQVTGSNYISLFQDNTFTNAILNTLLLMIVVVPIVIAIATMTCFGIWNSSKLSTKAVLAASNVTVATPESITGICLMLLFTSTVVPMGINLGFFTVVLAHISFGVPYAIIAIYPRMQKMNMNLIYAAQDCGYTKFQTFFKVIIPYLMPAIITGATIAIATSMDDFVITNLTNGSFQTIGTAIYSTRKGIKAWVVTFGAIVVLITIGVVIYMSLKQYLKEKLAHKDKLKRRLK